MSKRKHKHSREAFEEVVKTLEDSNDSFFVGPELIRELGDKKSMVLCFLADYHCHLQKSPNFKKNQGWFFFDMKNLANLNPNECYSESIVGLIKTGHLQKRFLGTPPRSYFRVKKSIMEKVIQANKKDVL